MNLLLAYEVYLVAALVGRGLVHWRTTIGTLRLIQRSPRWPNLLAATRRHRHLLLTLPNLLWAAGFLALLATYAAFLHLVYPGASVSENDLAAYPWLLAGVLAAALPMITLDLLAFARPRGRDLERTGRRLDQSELLLAWGGPIGRLMALPRLRQKLLQAGLTIHGWLRRSMLRLLLRGAVAVALWAPWAWAA